MRRVARRSCRSAARRPEDALRSLQKSSEAFASAGDSASEIMARGYAALADKLRPERRREAEAELQRIVQDLDEEGSDHAKFYRSQIIAADRTLCK